MMKETENVVHMTLDFLPLKSYANITEGNALLIDQGRVILLTDLKTILCNTPFYYALRETGYDVPEDKDTFSVECIRNTGIVNLAVNGANPYLIARLTGLSLGSLDVLLRRFEINIDEQSNIGEMINREISKFQFYQDI